MWPLNTGLTVYQVLWLSPKKFISYILDHIRQHLGTDNSFLLWLKIFYFSCELVYCDQQYFNLYKVKILSSFVIHLFFMHIFVVLKDYRNCDNFILIFKVDICMKNNRENISCSAHINLYNNEITDCGLH
jgi:hypothetical protein